MFWFLLLVVRVKALNVLPSGYEDSSVNCVEYIADKYLMSRCLAFLFPFNFSNPSVVGVPLLVRSDLLKNLHRKWAPFLPAASKGIRFVPFDYPVPTNHLHCAHIVVLSEDHSYSYQIDLMIATGFDTYFENGGGAKTRMVIVAPFEVRESEIHKVLFMMYERGEIDVIVVGMKENVLTVFTVFPFGQYGDRCQENTNVHVLDFWVNGSFSRGVDLFPNKTPIRFNNCTIQLSTINVPPFMMLDEHGRPYDGVDYQIVNLITDFFGLSANYNVYDRTDGVFWVENGKPHGAAADVWLGKVWMMVPEGVNSIFLFPSVYAPYSYMSADLAWHFEIPENVPTWKVLYLAFTGLLWAFFLASIVMFSYSLFVLLKFSENTASFSKCLLNACSIAVGNASLINRTSPVIRCAIASWLLAAFHINLAYVVSITGLITAGKSDPKIGTFDEIFEQKLTTAMRKPLVTFLLTIRTAEMKNIMLHHVPLNDYDITFYHMQKYRNVCIMDLDLILSYMINQKKLSIYKSNLKVYTAHFGILIKRNHFFVGRLLNITGRIYESGLSLKLLGDYTRSFWKTEGRTDAKAYTLNDLRGAFLVLLLGNSLAFIVFIGELVTSRF